MENNAVTLSASVLCHFRSRRFLSVKAPATPCSLAMYFSSAAGLFQVMTCPSPSLGLVSTDSNRTASSSIIGFWQKSISDAMLL